MAKYFLLIYFFITSAFAEQAKEQVTVFFYHLQPPLVIDLPSQTGLYFDFVRYLNSVSEDYQFELVYVPRKRIEKMLLDNSLKGILLGVNPKWFGDRQEQKYLWTESVFEDRDEVVSLASSPVEYLKPTSLKGFVIGGVRGFYYYGINEIVAQKQVLRVDTVDEVDLFSMLLKRRVDAAIIGRATYQYMIQKNQWQHKFHLSNKPHDSFARRILVPKDQEQIYSYLQQVFHRLAIDRRWIMQLEQYKQW